MGPLLWQAALQGIGALPELGRPTNTNAPEMIGRKTAGTGAFNQIRMANHF
jgi:hypothetical protein